MWFFTDEHQLIQDSVKQFGKKELESHSQEWDAKNHMPRELFNKMGEIGILGIMAPEEYGGSNMDCIAATIVMEEMAYFDAGITLSYLAHSILCVQNLAANGSPEQMKSYLPKLISGEHVGCMGMTEPDFGSDSLGIKSSAQLQGDSYLINGAKTFITNAPLADVFLVYARTGADKKTGLSTFILEKGYPGFEIGNKLDKMGMRTSPTGELFFQNTKVPKKNLVGKQGDSMLHMLKNLDVERITISGISLGIARRCIDEMVAYAKIRKQFGKSISEFQMIQKMVADSQAHFACAKSHVYNCAYMASKGKSGPRLGAESKLVSSEMATQVALNAVQVLGGYGYCKEYKVEKFMRDAKLMEIGAGTSEIMRYVIAREMFKG